MIIEDLHNGFFRLTAQNGVLCIPTGYVYSEVICKEKDIGKYRGVET